MKKNSREIVIVGANEHNLKNVNLTIPRDTLTVFTGVSGSGKSSLAFDIIFKEGQRRFVESLSSYARQFLGQTEKPKVEHIEGLSPTISVDQKTVNRNPRSTVGTITEIYDHFRLLFARLGTPHCPRCGIEITTQTADQITDHAYMEALNEPCLILAPMITERKGEYRRELEQWFREGFLRAQIDGKIRRLDEGIALARYEKHSINLVIDRMTLTATEKSRFVEGVERALHLTEGLVIIHYKNEDHLFSQLMACPRCQIAIPEMEPRLFSFNAPQGACLRCKGIGSITFFKEDKLCDPHKTLFDGALKCITERGNIMFTRIDQSHFKQLVKQFRIDASLPWGQLPSTQRKLILQGNARISLGISNIFRHGSILRKRLRVQKQWPGVIPILEYVNRFVKSSLEKFQDQHICPECSGRRLNPTALAVQFRGQTIETISLMSIEESLEFFESLQINEKERKIGRDIFREIRSRLKFLNDVGVGYLSLNRSAATLSGGEGQRIRLASQVGSGLQGVLYILDEPSIGLHQSDNQKLIHTLKLLRDRGNTVFVVEHDEETITSADHLVDIGPEAGKNGGTITAQGTLNSLIQSADSITGQYLAGHETIPIPAKRRSPNGAYLTIHEAALNNLRNITVKIPLGVFVAIAGVSGSGKSSLINGILKKALSQHLARRRVQVSELPSSKKNQFRNLTPSPGFASASAEPTPEHESGAENEIPGPHEKISGLQQIDRVIEINQSPIGRTPRSNPATYAKAFDEVRKLFASVPESKSRGYKPGRFSFNVKGGRCEDCKGAGIQTIEMQFLSDVQIPCDTCQGKRFNAETLQIYYKGKTIYDVLEMTVLEAFDFFAAIPPLARILQTLKDVGLVYMRLGQPSTTLSGGEAQRVKLAAELRKKSTGKTLYILDEPTTGLHFQDIRILLGCLNRLIDQGNTVIVIEHNLDVLKVADYLIELGPGGGKFGGREVCHGTPETVARDHHSLTGKFLKRMLKDDPARGLEGEASTSTVSESSSRRRRRGECFNTEAEPLGKGTSIKLPFSEKKQFEYLTPSPGEGDIVIKGASKNNLKHLDVTLPLNKMTVITGVSGSGKTSLAFDTIFAEGQARYLESLSTYARRFLGRVEKAPVDSIDGLAPAIAINQKTASRNPRSTVATTTEIYDYLRLLYARIGKPHCPLCGQPLSDYTPTRAAQYLVKNFDQQRVVLLSPLFRPDSPKVLLLDDPLHLKHIVSNLRAEGFVRLYVDNTFIHLDEWEQILPELSLTRKSVVDLVIDRVKIRKSDQKRFAEAIETAYQNGHGLLKLLFPDQNNATLFLSEHPGCVSCDYYQEEALTPRMFSFNSHVGACPACDGLGTLPTTKASKLEARLSNQKNPAPLQGGASRVGEAGTRDMYVAPIVCSACEGERLKPEYRAVRINHRNIIQFCHLNVREALAEVDSWKLSKNQQIVAEQALREISARLRFLVNVGLDYLSLNQVASTLSGGETQRIRLASQIGSGLVGVMYVLDEPTIGLHPRDTSRLLNTLHRLRDLGNTVILVEHDLDTMRAADHIIDIGPGAGQLGGKVVQSGTPNQLSHCKTSLTGQYLKGSKSIPLPLTRRPLVSDAEGRVKFLTVHGARANNLKNIEVSFPVGAFTVVTGVSGSGKSSLVIEILQKALQKHWYMHRIFPGEHDKITGLEHIDKFVIIDQEPIGKSPRSNPATYTKLMDSLRDLFAQLPAAKKRGFTKRRFSFNAIEGRCPACEGQGQNQIEMHFLSDVWIDCDECKGKRYNRETLRVTFRGHSIADVLNLEIDRAVELFKHQPRILRICKTLQEVGLGYIKLGQSGNTLSGGESQRVKLSAELAKRSTGKTLYILDEPTTGLHIDDIARLLQILHRLVQEGNTVIVIEHNPDVIKTADYIIDLGPEGGDNGGRVVFAGKLDEVIDCPASHTGRSIRPLLDLAN